VSLAFVEQGNICTAMQLDILISCLIDSVHRILVSTTCSTVNLIFNSWALAILGLGWGGQGVGCYCLRFHVVGARLILSMGKTLSLLL